MLELTLKIINFLVLGGFPLWTFFLVKSKFSSPFVVLLGLILVGALNDYLFVGKQSNDDIGFMIFFVVPSIFIFFVYVIVWITYKHVTGGMKGQIKTENIPVEKLETLKKEYRGKLWNRIAMFTVYIGGVLFLIFLRDYLGALPFLLFCLIRALFPILTNYVMSGTEILGNWGSVLEVFWFISIWLSVSEIIMRTSKKRILASTCYLVILMVFFWLFIGTFSGLKMSHAWQQEEYKTMKENEVFAACAEKWQSTSFYTEMNDEALKKIHEVCDIKTEIIENL